MWTFDSPPEGAIRKLSRHWRFDLALEHIIGGKPDGVQVIFRFQRIVKSRSGKGCVSTKEPTDLDVAVPSHNRPRTERQSSALATCPFQVTERIETEQRMEASAAKMPVVRGALLLAVRLTDRTVHIQDDRSNRLTASQTVDPDDPILQRL